jgi:hypothetical protein
LVVGSIDKPGRLVTLGRVRYFGAVINAELVCLWPIQLGFTLVVVDLSAEVFEGCLDALFDDFESAIVSKRSLLLNLDFWSITHVLRASTVQASKNAFRKPERYACSERISSARRLSRRRIWMRFWWVFS